MKVPRRLHRTAGEGTRTQTKGYWMMNKYDIRRHKESHHVQQVMLKMLCNGLTRQQVADSLYMTKANVDRHLRRCKLRFKAKTWWHLIFLAKEAGLVCLLASLMGCSQPKIKPVAPTKALPLIVPVYPTNFIHSTNPPLPPRHYALVSSNNNPQYAGWVIEYRTNINSPWLFYSRGTNGPNSEIKVPLDYTNAMSFFRIGWEWLQ